MQAADLPEDQALNFPENVFKARAISWLRACRTREVNGWPPLPSPLLQRRRGRRPIRWSRGLLEEVHDSLSGDAVGVETARENAGNLTTPAQTPDLVIRKQQGLLEYSLPIFCG